MTTQKIVFIAVCFFLFTSVGCGDNQENNKESKEATAEASSEPANDPKGVGKFKNVELTHPLDEKMIAQGQKLAEVKCYSCHKVTDERLVGPGWKGVTDRRTPEWIMNFVTNPDEMLQKDTAAQNMLEVCLVKMPNQSLTDEDARAVLELMRKNDGKN